MPVPAPVTMAVLPCVVMGHYSSNGKTTSMAAHRGRRAVPGRVRGPAPARATRCLIVRPPWRTQLPPAGEVVRPERARQQLRQRIPALGRGVVGAADDQRVGTEFVQHLTAR